MTERERLLHLSAAQELKLHAAKHDARLMITEPEIDIEGFDFTISSEFESLYVQSKGTLKKGGKKSWNIRAALLKPSFYNRDLMPDLDGLKVGGYAIGATGGVLLHIIDEAAAEAGCLQISYRYLDIYWLVGVASGVAGLPLIARQRALELLRIIREADDEESVKLNITDFAKLRSLSALANFRLHIGGLSNWASGCHTHCDLAELRDPDDHFLFWQGVRDLLHLS
ncbi:hypothetical protein [Methylobacterium sp. Leaf469]|uniref:hypothetical protein n=1 Tax=Methylobacterium sp. Leaf469 TaxID=1736387 RepID=UPI0012E3B5BE|nr:hypothetical protein [Methylobacterium sp. Leaf469]